MGIFFWVFVVVEEGEAVLKAVSFWWQVCHCVPRKYALFFGVFLGRVHMSYHNTLLSNVYLFEVCSLPALKPKSLFLGSCILKTGIVCMLYCFYMWRSPWYFIIQSTPVKVLEVLLVILIIYQHDDYCFQVCIEISV